MPPRWLILADDLTGAADCGIAFARRGREAVVGWGAGGPPSAAVLAIDADSRGLGPAEAAARHRTLLRRHLAPGMRLIKKIDSTLRGQPAAELRETLAALREESDRRPVLALVAPAFPATGRTLRGGRIHLHGQPLEATPLWAREHRYPSADLGAVLTAEGLRTRLLPLAALRADAAGAIGAALDAGIEALVCDAERPEDLAILARAGLGLAPRLLWTGSGGIAAALAEADADVGAPGAPPRLGLPPAGRGLLAVVGSLAEASRAAAAQLAASGGVRRFALAPARLRGGAMTEGVAIRAALAAGETVLVEIAAEAGADLGQGAALAGQLAALLAPAAPHLGGLFATGGETARALLDRLGIAGIRLVEEVEPGVPLGLALPARPGGPAIPVVTKAGAFGTAATIARSLDRLRALPAGDPA
jgi:uncharacterized protein YgbK (DUF1537 family)